MANSFLEDPLDPSIRDLHMPTYLRIMGGGKPMVTPDMHQIIHVLYNNNRPIHNVYLIIYMILVLIMFILCFQAKKSKQTRKRAKPGLKTKKLRFDTLGTPRA